MTSETANGPGGRHRREEDDAALHIAQAYSNSGIHNFIGTPYATEPLPPDQVPLAADDTLRYLEARAAWHGELSHPDTHYDATMGPTDAQKPARQLVEEWADAEHDQDKTRQFDIQRELRSRVQRWRLRSVSTTGRPGHRTDAQAVLESFEALRARQRRRYQQKFGAVAVRKQIGPGPAPNLDGPIFEPADPPDVIDPPIHPHIPPPRPPAPPGSPPPAPPPQPPAAPQADARPSRNPFVRANDALKYHTGRFMLALADPEKGRRRQGLLALGIAAVSFAGGFLLCYLTGHHAAPKHITNPTFEPPVEPPPAPPIIPPPPPPVELPPPAVMTTPQVNTGLAEGHNYIWGAYQGLTPGASGGQVSRAILNDVDTLQNHGWDVNVWRNPRNRNLWGISPTITAPDDQYLRFADGHIEHLDGQVYKGVAGRTGALRYADAYAEADIISGQEAQALMHPVAPPATAQPESYYAAPASTPAAQSFHVVAQSTPQAFAPEVTPFVADAYQPIASPQPVPPPVPVFVHHTPPPEPHVYPTWHVHMPHPAPHANWLVYHRQLLEEIIRETTEANNK